MCMETTDTLTKMEDSAWQIMRDGDLLRLRLMQTLLGLAAEFFDEEVVHEQLATRANGDGISREG